jgi:hypothetical protein
MTGWDRVAWACSWVAPIAAILTVGSLGLAIGAQRGVEVLRPYGSALQMGVLACAITSALAHVLLVYQVHKRAHLAPEEASRLAGLLHFGFGYSDWREAIKRRGQR